MRVFALAAAVALLPATADSGLVAHGFSLAEPGSPKGLPLTVAEKYRGRSLTEALTMLQAAGLRIVFTSKIVPSDLRVAIEPRSPDPRKQLDELLAPHGLKVEEGPGGTLQVVRSTPKNHRADRVKRAAAPREPPHESPPALPDVHTEYVNVIGQKLHEQDRGIAAETSIDGDDLADVAGTIVDDPVYAAHMLPRVSAIDDLRGDFAVRASPPRHIEVVVDGVSTPWLRHMAAGRASSGSLTMLTGEVVEEATLRSGAHPQRYGDHLGAQLELTLREGSRDSVHVRGAVGGMNATVSGEGPLGKSRKGSWLIAARQSYLTWPPNRDAHQDAFGFGDAIGRAVLDVRPSQQVGVTVLRGTSDVDDEEDGLASGESGGAINTTTMANVVWRSAIGSSMLVHQRVYVVSHRAAIAPGSELVTGSGADNELAYRANVVRSTGRGTFDGGVQFSRLTAREAVAVDAAAQRSAYGQFRWNMTSNVTLSPGLRVTVSNLTSRPIVSRWMLGEYAMSADWRLRASAGVSYQLPELRLAAGSPVALRPEQATNVDVSLEHRLSPSATWQFTVFNRQESNVLRDRPALESTSRLSGTSGGVEVQIARRHSSGLNGWAAYSYGKARQRDDGRDETFWADFDQRHALTLVGWYRVAASMSVGITYRATSNIPVPAYLQDRMERLPPYSRLDVRADHHLRQLGGRVTLFGEVLNLTNHANLGIRDTAFASADGGATRVLMRRRAAAGMVVEF